MVLKQVLYPPTPPRHWPCSANDMGSPICPPCQGGAIILFFYFDTNLQRTTADMIDNVIHSIFFLSVFCYAVSRTAFANFNSRTNPFLSSSVAEVFLYFRPTTTPIGSRKRKSFSSPLITSKPSKSVSGNSFA